MRKKMYWGLASLILIIGVVGVYFMLQSEPDPEPEKKFIVPSEADLEQAREARKPPPGASPNGHWHGDEWHDEPHEVPVAQNDPPAAHPDTVQPKQHAIDAVDNVIYPHHELLQRHPVAALRAQAKDNGHWSTRYIPPFPPDDAEANELARNIYIRNYYKGIGEPLHPLANKVWKEISEWERNNGPPTILFPSPRQWDLIRLLLTGHDEPPFDTNYRTTWFGVDRLNWIMDSTFTGEEYENAYNNQ